MDNLHSIADPSTIEEVTLDIPQEITLVPINVTLDGGQEVPVEEATEESIPRLETDIKTNDIFAIMKGGVVQKEHRKLYYMGEEGEMQRWCGPVLQIIPEKNYANVSDGTSTGKAFTPDEDDDDVKFEKERQLAIRAGRKPERDYALIVAQNGCVLIENNAFCLMDMPAFIVEPGGDYYSIEHGQRNLLLGPGGHIILYAKEMPMLFITIPKRPREAVEEPQAEAVEEVSPKGPEEEPTPEPVQPVTDQPFDYQRDGIWYDDAREAVEAVKKDQEKDEQSAEQVPPDALKEKNITLSRIIAVGGFSVVYEGLFNDKKVAVKVIDKSKLSNEVKEQHLPQELIMVESLNQDNIILTQTVETVDERVFIVMDLADMDMVDNISKYGTVLEKDWAKIWISQIITAVKYLHNKGVAHRDLKLENFLLVNGVAKLCDFTFTCYAVDPNDGTDRLDNTYCGSLPYVAPEVLARTPHDPRASDIWSLGVCIYAMITFKFPFGTRKIEKIQERQKSGKWEYPSDVSVSDGLDQFLKEIFIHDFKERPNIDAVSENKWFSSSDEASPKTGDESPKTGDESPKTDDELPKNEDETPKTEDETPKKEEESPDSSSTSPEPSSPDSGVGTSGGETSPDSGLGTSPAIDEPSPSPSPP